jgi:hypothetical protein
MSAEERAERKRRAEELQNFKLAAEAIYSSPPLRALLAWLYQSSGMAQSPFSTSALTMAFLSGKMAQGQELFHLLEQSLPGLTVEILKEVKTNGPQPAPHYGTDGADDISDYD